MAEEARPALTAELSGAELQRWYWLRSELIAFARDLGVSASGGKQLLTERLAARLDGSPFIEPARHRSASGSLTPPFAQEDLVPAGQRCTQELRAWFTAEVGAGFRFDGVMRAFFADADGSQTLGDAVDLWHRSRTAERLPIDGQFEYNRFTRAWRDAHPGGDAAELRAAWWEYRSRPVDERGRV